MQIIITERDLQNMPKELYAALLDYLSQGGRPTRKRKPRTQEVGAFVYAPLVGAQGTAGEEVLVLNRSQALGLVREVSFGRNRKALRTILQKIAHPDSTRPPTVQRIAKALRIDVDRVRAHLNGITRTVRRLTDNKTARLFRFKGSEGVCDLHPDTRHALREVLAALERAGEREEALWE